MRLLYALLMALCAAPLGAANSQNFAVRLLLGLTDREPAQWDGSVEARGARIASIEPWRFEVPDEITGHSWRISTHRIRLFGAQRQNATVVANGVVVRLEDAGDNTELDVKTTQGNFTVRLAAIPYGKSVHELGGRAMADRVPASTQITSSPEEEDYPAAAMDKAGNVWLAYVEFRHNKDHNRLRANFKTPPSDFSEWKAPTGGDQILVKKYSGGQWSEAMEITPAGGDLYRPAIAVDGSGRPWVFWSANERQNFDLWARAIENGKPGRTVRLSSQPGSDVDAVAAADSKGRVWVAWQGWRNGRAAIFAATQSGNGFSRAMPVSSSTGDEWNPAIAADRAGRITVAWDSYRSGNYDVFLRTASGPGSWGKETPVAATAKYEAYPSVAYDPGNRLWVAYEAGGERWGKDWGAYDTQGVSVYQARAVRLLGFAKDGSPIETSADVGAVLPGVPNRLADSTARQNDRTDWMEPNPDATRERRPSASSPPRPGPKNNLPRLAFDSSGRLWLAFRSAQPIWWNPLGTVWGEYVTSYSGGAWTGPVFLMHTGNLLDNRPALISTRAGELMLIGSTDSRRQFQLVQRRGGGEKPPNQEMEGVVDPYNNDLYSNTIDLGPASAPMAVRAGAATTVAGPQPVDKAERAAIARMREYRTADGLRLVRGEFHRHSSISMDGGNDGTIRDQWRYILDAASLDWVGCCDHDNGGGREYSWWTIQKLTDVFYSPGHFSPMFSYERSVPYPEGHRNVIFVERGVRTLPRLPKMDPDSTGHAPDTQMLYRYLKYFNGIVGSHTSATNMGTDWRDNDSQVEPVVEIYQGLRQDYERPDAPRANSANDSIGGWRPKGFVNLALEMGYKMSFEASSDHVSTHISYSNVWVTDVTRESVLEGFKKRHTYGATDNILADFRSGSHMMGDAFSTAERPRFEVKLWGTAPFVKVRVIKDNQYVYATEPGKAEVSFTWEDNAAQPGKTSYYYVRGEQENGDIVWVSPMWVTYTGGR